MEKDLEEMFTQAVRSVAFQKPPVEREKLLCLLPELLVQLEHQRCQAASIIEFGAVD